jgi:hypothetical protein
MVRDKAGQPVVIVGHSVGVPGSPERPAHGLVADAEAPGDRAGRHAETVQKACPFAYLLVLEGLSRLNEREDKR